MLTVGSNSNELGESKLYKKDYRHEFLQIKGEAFFNLKCWSMINNVHALITAALRENPALSPEYVK